jgi:putative spermidine/putrescine transport system permease protein
VADAAVVVERGALPARPARRFGFSWIGLLPFFLFSFAFIVMPTAYLVAGSLQKNDKPSLQNYADLGTGVIPLSLLTSIEVSLVTAVAGGILGFLLAYAIILGGLPRFLRTAVMTFSGVA